MKGATARRIRATGRLTAGVSLGIPGLSARTGDTWHGFDVDLARAVAAAALDGDPEVVFVALAPQDRLSALDAGRVDLVTANATWTAAREAEHQVSFAGVSLYDGETALVPEASPVRRVLDLDQRRVAAQKGTTTARNLQRVLGPTRQGAIVQEYATPEEAREAYAHGDCEAYVLDSIGLCAERLALPDPDRHRLLDGRLSKEPMGPLVRDGDSQWFKAVRWVLLGLIWAEENDLDQHCAGDLLSAVHPDPEPDERPPRWLLQAVRAVGNYAEIFTRNLGAGSPLCLPRGPNDLWTRGGLLYAPPL